MSRTFPLIVTILLSSSAFSQQTPSFQTETIPQYDALFDRTDGWTGADGAYTVALNDDTNLWLFSDTWVGKIREGKHVECTMINNSVGVQTGKDPSCAKVEFFYNTKEGKPASLITPVDGNGWYWLFDGVLANNELFVFLMQTVKTGDSVFGFDRAATWLGRIDNPYDPPTQWRVAQTKVPWDRKSPKGNSHFGSAIIKENDMVYLYGVDEEKRNGWLHRYAVLARVEEDKLGDFDAWRFYSNDGWVSDFEKSKRMCDRVGCEFSVSYQPSIKKYILLTTESGMSEKIILRTADRPWGDWSEPVTVFQCPDGKWDDKYFTYAGKAHPTLSGVDDLLFTYVCNSFDFGKMVNDSRIYHPRFVRIRFDSSQ